jgi:formylglycine-generating enzyme required for sulfatase activity
MGSPELEADRDDNEGPQHEVGVSGFYIGKYEVTVGEFRRFVEITGYRTTAETSGGGMIFTSRWEEKLDANWKNPYFTQGDNQPVVLVSWYDAIEYCNWRSREEGLGPAYMRNGDSVTWDRSADGYRLPTEAEWEYACRAGSMTAYSTGGSITTGQANYEWKAGKTSDVGSYAPNSWGLYDMHGNVREWCWDWRGPYSGGVQTDPEGPPSGTNRIERGGSWNTSGRNLRSAYRGSGTPSYRSYSLGFRLVRP